MLGSHSIAAGAAIALMTISSLSASPPVTGCEGPDAPLKAVVDSAKHDVVITLGPVPRPTIVLPFKADVNIHPGAGDAFDLPPGGGSQSAVFTMAVSGRLIAVGGHLHDFGKEVRLEDVATGKVLARVNALRTPSGEVTGVSHGLYGILGRGPHLIAGRRYRLVAVYQGSPKDSIIGAMGLMGGIFAPDDYAQWSKLDRTNPDYLIDLSPKGQRGVLSLLAAARLAGRAAATAP